MQGFTAACPPPPPAPGNFLSLSALRPQEGATEEYSAEAGTFQKGAPAFPLPQPQPQPGIPRARGDEAWVPASALLVLRREAGRNPEDGQALPGVDGARVTTAGDVCWGLCPSPQPRGQEAVGQVHSQLHFKEREGRPTSQGSLRHSQEFPEGGGRGRRCGGWDRWRPSPESRDTTGISEIGLKDQCMPDGSPPPFSTCPAAPTPSAGSAQALPALPRLKGAAPNLCPFPGCSGTEDCFTGATQAALGLRLKGTAEALAAPGAT